MLAPTRTFARGHTAVLRALLRLRCHDDIVHDDVAVTLFMLLAVMFFVRLIVLFVIISVVWMS